MGYYIVQWKSKPYTLQEDAEGMLGTVTAGEMVVDRLYFNRPERGTQEVNSCAGVALAWMR